MTLAKREEDEFFSLSLPLFRFGEGGRKGGKIREGGKWKLLEEDTHSCLP